MGLGLPQLWYFVILKILIFYIIYFNALQIKRMSSFIYLYFHFTFVVSTGFWRKRMVEAVVAEARDRGQHTNLSVDKGTVARYQFAMNYF